MTSSLRLPATMSVVAVSSRRHSAVRLLATALFIAAATLLQSAAAAASATPAADHVVSATRPLPVESDAVGQQRKTETTLIDELSAVDPQQDNVGNREQFNDDRSAEKVTDLEIRPKRDWKSSRAQAAWGKRATPGAAGSDEVASQEADARRRRKWNQSRQAWGKRAEDGEGSELGDDKLEDFVDGGVGYGWNKRKWGSANVKTAWGKRKWGANNDMRVWGKRFIVADDSVQNELEDSDEQEFKERNGHRFRRSIDQETVENWVPHFQAAIRRHRSPSSTSSGTRVYIGPKRNWQTNTMKVWGKRSSYDDVDDDDWFSAASNSDNENLAGTNDEADELTPWNGAGLPLRSSGTRPLGAAVAAWKRGWSGDNSLRVWGK